MTIRFPLLAMLVLVVLLGVSLAGIAVMSGALRHWPNSRLTANMRLFPVNLPGEIALDPLVIAEYLEKQIGDRARNDTALRVTIGAENAAKFVEAVLPRLVNSLVMERMIDGIPPLKAALSMDEFKTVAELTVRNTGATPLDDVAATVPGALVAELTGGEPLDITTSSTGLTVMWLGTLAPGESRSLSVWSSLAQDVAGTLESQIAVGAAQGLDASLAIYGRQDWRGEDLEVQSWARWAIAAILVSVALASLALLAGVVGSAWRQRRVRPA